MKPSPIRSGAGALLAAGKLSLAVSVALTALSTPTPAAAQARALEEVIVTARKRDESLQETPVAITAFSGTRLQESGITNLSDFNRVIPNLDVQAGNGNAGVANIYIRGVGQRNTEPNLDSGVGVYLDGVYVGRSDGALLDVNDLQSVQVLRGPQGTLFGKNTTGGALVFTTNRPSPELEGSLLVRGGNYQRRDAEGMINIPLVDDTLYTRLSVVSKVRDGYVKNLYDGQYYNDEDRISAVWQLRWLPSDTLTVDLNANYGKTAQKPHLQKCVPSANPDDLRWAWQLKLLDPYVRYETGRNIMEYCRESERLDEYEAMSDLGGSYNAENKGVSLTLDWAINDHLSLKSISGWRETTAGQDDDLDSLALGLLHRTNNSQPFAQERITDQYSQEFQLVGDAFGGSLTYATGLYGFIEKTGQSRTANLVGPLRMSTPSIYVYNSTATTLRVDNKAWSAFAQVDWNFAQSWRLTVGTRYTWEERELEQIFYKPDPATMSLSGGLVSPMFNDGAYNFWGRANDFNPNHGYIEDGRSSDAVKATAWTPMVSLQYFIPSVGPIDNGSMYLTVSEGFRSGGLTESSAGPVEFEPEEVKNYELGIKIDAFDSRLRLNTALFHMDYTDRQLTTVKFDPLNAMPAQATINAKDSSISGIEIESMLIPIDGLEITLNATWNRGRIKEFEDTQVAWNPATADGRGGTDCTNYSILVIPVSECTIDRSDENLPRLAKRSFLAAIQYAWQTSIGVVIPRIQGSWKFDQDNCFDRSSCVSGQWYTDKQFDLSARLTWMSIDEHWMAALYGSNLTSEVYSIGGTALVDAMAYGGQSYNIPKMYGAEIQYRW